MEGAHVIGNLLDAEGFEYLSSEEVLEELSADVGTVSPDNTYPGSKAIEAPNGADDPAKTIDIPIYQVDAVVRRAAALQLTPEAQRVRDASS